MSDGALNQADYVLAVDIINQLLACGDKDNLYRYVKDTLMPIFRSDAFAMHWHDFDFDSLSPRGLDTLFTIGIPDAEIPVMNIHHNYMDHFNTGFATSSKVVQAHGVDFPPAVYSDSKTSFFRDHPEYRSNTPVFDSLHSILGITNQPDFSVAIAFIRGETSPEPFSHRDVRLAELIQPMMVATMRNIALKEDLKRYQDLSAVLLKIPTPTALINARDEVVYANKAFEVAVQCQQHDILPQELANAVSAQKAKYLQTDGVEVIDHFQSIGSLSQFFQQGNQRWRITFESIDDNETSPDQCYLLRLKSVFNSYDQSLIDMKSAGLTHREIEVAFLIKDGNSNQQIANRLFLTVNTVKSHIKNIHRKMKTSHRADLVAKLNQRND